MSNVLHIHFNKKFENFLKEVHNDTYKAVLETVADISAQTIRSYCVVSRCPTRINDQIRSQVGNDSLIIYAVLKNYVLIFIDHRRF